MMHWLVVVSVVVAAGAAGCAPDPLTMDQRMQVLVETNRRLQQELFERDRRIAELAGGEAVVDFEHPAPPVATPGSAQEDPFKAVQIELGSITGPADFDGRAGDDGVRVLVQPRDRYGDLVKRAGTLEVDVVDAAREGAEQRFADWQFTQTQLAPAWVSGLLGVGGYSLELKWPSGKLPERARLKLVVRFTTLDSRTLEATKDIEVKLPPAAAISAPAPTGIPPATPAPVPGEMMEPAPGK